MLTLVCAATGFQIKTRAHGEGSQTHPRVNHRMPPSTTTTASSSFQYQGAHCRYCRVAPLGPVLNTQEPSPVSYSERSRAFRRDFYTHDSWIRHRSKERFLGTLIKMVDSGVVRALLDELLVVGGVATFVVVYNAVLVTGWQDFSLLHHDALSTDFPLMFLPLTGFTLSSSALSLLLGTCQDCAI